MGVACAVEEGRFNRYMKSVSICRGGESVAGVICAMMSRRPILISIEIFDATLRKSSGAACPVFSPDELNS